MKRLLLIAVSITCLFAARAQTRMTLHEEFTGENCGPCATTNPGFWAMCDEPANAEKLIQIAYMSDIPPLSTHNFYLETRAIGDARNTYYSVPFAPYGRYDGGIPDPLCGTPPGLDAGHINCFTQSDIDAEAAKAAPISISAIHYFSTGQDSVYGRVTIKGVSAVGGSKLVLRTAFVKSMTFVTAPGDNSETNFENIVRAMYPSEAGQPIATAWDADSVATYTYSGKITDIETLINDFTVPDSGFVVWVQNDSSKGILQAARSVYDPAGLGVRGIAISSMALGIYPNPAKESVTLSFRQQDAGNVRVRVVDELGRTVNNVSKNMAAGPQKIEVQVDELPRGIYMVQLQTENKLLTKRLEVIK